MSASGFSGSSCATLATCGMISISHTTTLRISLTRFGGQREVLSGDKPAANELIANGARTAHKTKKGRIERNCLMLTSADDDRLRQGTYHRQLGLSGQFETLTIIALRQNLGVRGSVFDQEVFNEGK